MDNAYVFVFSKSKYYISDLNSKKIQKIGYNIQKRTHKDIIQNCTNGINMN